ncbi:MAG: hypothetical protein NZ951_08285 [Dehalococcoidia bacterium]|nr:hypothetical protein [Dehalococcoidia bacterium]MDW8120443.1 hypothetical protein [Chloroflexota bacterium]
MIVRIHAEGQFQVPSALLDTLNDLDNQAVDAVAKGDYARFLHLLRQMHRLVREQGKPLPPSDLRVSDVVLPSEDITLDEARALFGIAGLIPG